MKHHLPCVDRDSDGEWVEVREITAKKKKLYLLKFIRPVSYLAMSTPSVYSTVLPGALA